MGQLSLHRYFQYSSRPCRLQDIKYSVFVLAISFGAVLLATMVRSCMAKSSVFLSSNCGYSVKSQSFQCYRLREVIPYSLFIVYITYPCITVSLKCLSGGKPTDLTSYCHFNILSPAIHRSVYSPPPTRMVGSSKSEVRGWGGFGVFVWVK